MRAILALAAVLIMSGSATADYLVYRVVNVDPMDVLNIRATANPVSAIRGELPHDAEMVEVLEEEAGWGRIIYDGVEGWVSTAYLAPMPRPRAGQTIAPGGFVCSGTEPFWGLTLDESGAVEFYDAQTFGEAWDADVHDGRIASSRPYPYAYHFSGRISGMAILDRGMCSDGMSDFNYGWRAYVDVRDDDNGARLLEGCCRTPVRD